MALRAVAGPRNPTSIGTVAPAGPQPGQMWWNLDDVKLYVWDGAEWVVTVNTPEVTGGAGGGELPEAPSDGQIYGRNGQLTNWTPVLPMSGGTVPGGVTFAGVLAASGNTGNPGASVNTALFTGTGAYGNQAAFPQTSVWMPNGCTLMANPTPFGAGAFATTLSITSGILSSWVPQVNGGYYPPMSPQGPTRDVVGLICQSSSLAPLLVLPNVTFDTTHVYISPPLTPTQIAEIQPQMMIDTNHCPKFSGVVTGVASDGSSITVGGWFQAAGAYITILTVVSPGSGYAVGDNLVLEAGANMTECAYLHVTSVDGSGRITGSSIGYAGSYSTDAVTRANPDGSLIAYPLYGGHGSGATVSTQNTGAPANNATGQNPQSVALIGSSPPPFHAYVTPRQKAWAQNNLVVVGTGADPQPWQFPWVQGGNLSCAVGCETSASNNTGTYIKGNGIYTDFPNLWGQDVVNLGNARASIAYVAREDFGNAFLTENQLPDANAFAAHSSASGWTFAVNAGTGSLDLGAQAAAAAATINFHNIGSTQIDGTIGSYGGTSGTPYAGTLYVTAVDFHAAAPGGNNLHLQPGSAGSNACTIFCDGADANINLYLTPKAGGFVESTTFFHAPGTGASYFLLDAGASWGGGAGVPTSTQPVGSIYSRSDGTVGSALYISAGGGTWNPAISAGGGIITGTLGVVGGIIAGSNTLAADNTLVAMDTVAGHWRNLAWQTGGVNRWTISCDSSAETGGNAGSNLVLINWSDAGANLSNALSINRATGGVSIPLLGTGSVGFQGAAPISRPTVSGAKSGNAALASLMTALAAYGLVTDNTT